MNEFNQKTKDAADRRKARLTAEYELFQQREQAKGKRGSVRQFAIKKGLTAARMYQLLGG